MKDPEARPRSRHSTSNPDSITSTAIPYGQPRPRFANSIHCSIERRLTSLFRAPTISTSVSRHIFDIIRLTSCVKDRYASAEGIEAGGRQQPQSELGLLPAPDSKRHLV